MADHALFLSAFHSAEVNNSRTQSKSQDVQVAVADNECAQALLMLATAATRIQHHNSSSSKRISSNNTSTETACPGKHKREPGTERCCSSKKSSSILKRQLQSTGGSIRQKKGGTSGKLEGRNLVADVDKKVDSHLQSLLIKRIKLDHNYAEEAKDFRGTIETKESLFLNGKPKRGDNQNDVTGAKSQRKSSSPAGASTSNSQKTSKPSNGNSQNTATDGSGKNDPYQFQDSEQDAKKLTTEHSPDLYEPTDSKYKNFNLLLRCLTTEEPTDDAVVHFSSRKRCNTIGSSATQDLSGSEEGLVSTDPQLLTDYNEHQCKCCFKVFSRKRYLTKHLSRMHPDTDASDGDKDDLVSCPNCTHFISCKNFKRHSHVCNAHVQKSKKQLEMDLANCQFCGIRMRRHILVKHLAQEHCVENIKSATEALFRLDEEYSDSDSSTLSGSDNQDERHSPSKDLIVCSLCNVLVRRALIKDHVQRKHPPPTSNNSASDTTATTSPGARTAISCQLCGLEVSRSGLMRHLAEEHCTENAAAAANTNAAKVETPKRSSSTSCTHSMLQRFLSESSGDLDSFEPTDQCQSCINGLVKLANLTAVSRSPAAGSADSPCGDLTLTNGAAVCVVGKDRYSSLSPLQRSSETVPDSASNKTPV